MGMTIMQAKQEIHNMWMFLSEDGHNSKTTQALAITETVLSDYDENLKSDMIAMLSELKDEINEQKYPQAIGSYKQGVNVGLYCGCKAIQQRINNLRQG